MPNFMPGQRPWQQPGPQPGQSPQPQMSPLMMRLLPFLQQGRGQQLPWQGGPQQQRPWMNGGPQQQQLPWMQNNGGGGMRGAGYPGAGMPQRMPASPPMGMPGPTVVGQQQPGQPSGMVGMLGSPQMRELMGNLGGMYQKNRSMANLNPFAGFQNNQNPYNAQG